MKINMHTTITTGTIIAIVAAVLNLDLGFSLVLVSVLVSTFVFVLLSIISTSLNNSFINKNMKCFYEFNVSFSHVTLLYTTMRQIYYYGDLDHSCKDIILDLNSVQVLI